MPRFSRPLRSTALPTLLSLALVLAAMASASNTTTAKPASSWQPTPEECALLDDPNKRGKMDGLLRALLVACGRESELGQVRSADFRAGVPADGPSNPDVQVNDSSGDTNTSTTQSETSIARNEVTGTLCSGYNDSNDFSTLGGFSRSTDGGATWDDRGSVPGPSDGDPSLVWRRADGRFYYALLRSGGIGIWRSDDDCLTFTFVTQVGFDLDDKELMAVDNNPASPFFGRMYLAWTDFGSFDRIYERHSIDGGVSWSESVALSEFGVDVQGAWPTVAPNGDVYIGWVRWNPFPSGPIDIEIARSTDGGAFWDRVTNPMTGEVNPRDSAATASCFRPALNENIRYLPSPQLAVGPDGALHVVYSYDPDGFDLGDVVDVFYRKSVDKGATWGPEIRLNDDTTLSDQYFPTLSVSPENIVVATWYDRRLDPANALQDTFKTVSPDGGASWLPNERVSDVSTPIYLDPQLAICYHGDYDQVAQQDGFVGLLQWSDDRNLQNGHNDPDVWFELTTVSNDFLIRATPSTRQVCAPDDAAYALDVLQFQGFSEPVTLAASGHPAGTSAAFGTNPVTPPGTSTLTISGTGAAAAGSYPMLVTGTSSPSGIVREVTLTLDLFDEIPGAPNLLLPPDGATAQPTRPAFSWSAVAQAASYTVEVATDAAFTDVVAGAGDLQQPNWVPDIDLDTNIRYYWRVRAENDCGVGADSATFDFITASVPGDCTFGLAPKEVFFDDLESGAPGWTHSGNGDTWQLSSTRTHSGTNAFWAHDVSSISDQYLVSPTVILPLGEAPLTLKFWNWQEIESFLDDCFDGAVVEISIDNGASWTRLESELLTDPYDGEVDNCCDNPIGGDNAWCGDPQDWLASIVDLDAFAGATVRFRFRLATDIETALAKEGWYVDDVEVQSCPALIFTDGFESGDTSAWSGSLP